MDSLKRYRSFLTDRKLCVALALFMMVSSVAYSNDDEAFEEFALFEEIPTVSSVSRMKESIDDAPAAIDIITAEDLKRWGVVELPDAFRFIAGMDVTSFNGRVHRVTARGMNGLFARQMLVLIDGVSVYTPLFSNVNFEHLPLIVENIERIEIIRGPNSLYGMNALNGVINITTKSANQSGFLGKYTLGNHERDNFVLRMAEGVDLDSFGQLDVSLAYSFNQDDGYGDNNGEEFADAKDSHILNVNAKHVIDEKFSFDYQFNARTGREDRSPLSPSGGFSTTFEQRPTFHNFMTRFNFLLDNGHAGFLQFHRWVRDVRTKSLSAGLPVSDSKEQQYALELQDEFGLFDDRTRLVWGMTYKHNVVESLLVRRKVATNEVQSTRDHLYSAYINQRTTLLEDLPFLEDLSLAGGVALEGSKLISNTHFAPRISLLYTPVDGHVIRATYGRAFRHPSFLEEYGTIFTPQNTGSLGQLIGNRSLEPVEVNSVEAGYSGNFLENRLKLDVDTYLAGYRQLVDVASTQPLVLGVQPQINQAFSSKHADTYGVELSGRYKPNDTFGFFANYTYARVLDDIQPVFTQPFEGGTPKHKANFGMNIDFKEDTIENMPFLEGANLNVLVHYRDSYLDHNSTGSTVSTFGVKRNIRLDLRLAKSFFDDAMEVAVVAQNLIGKDHNEAQFVEVPRLFFFTVSIHDYPWNLFKTVKSKMAR